MNEARTCEQCGAVLDFQAPEGLCPRCVLATVASDALAAAPLPVAQASSPAGPGGSAARSEAGQGFPADQQTGMPALRRFGDYELLEEIARGGMGVVFRARQVSLNRIVAVKMILAGQLAGEVEIQRFRAEAESAAQLQHPNIVAIHEVGVHDRQHYFSMDFVEGQNLTEFVRNRPLSSKQAATYLKTIAEAIHYAHQHGILHRDLKPSNILIDESDQPRVSDFGLARQMKGDSDLTLSGQVLGSPNFMPPEQAAGKRSQVGPHSDVYSLGAILYYLLTARAPFAAETMTETLQLVLNEQPPAPRLLNPIMSRDLETICLKCLEKEPGKRYAAAQKLADELGRFLRDEPIRARPVSAAGKACRWARRKPALASALAVVLLLALVLGIGSPIAAFRINRARLQAQTKEKEATDRLRDSYLAQARAGRWSGRAGRRFESLEALRKAAEIRPAPELRNEAVACMTLVDLRVIRESLDWHGIPAEAPLAFDSEYERCACADTNGSITVYQVADGRELTRLTGCAPPFHRLWLSPNGKYLAARFGKSPYRLRIWDLGSNQEVPTPAERSASQLAFGHDGRTVALGAFDGPPLIYDLVARKTLKSLSRPVSPWFLEFHPSDRKLAVADERNLNVEILDLETERVIQSLPHSNTVRAVAWHPDGNLLATACTDTHIYVWNAITGKIRAVLSGHQNAVTGVEFNHAGDLLASTSWDGDYRLWDPFGARPLVSVPSTALGHFSPDDHWEIGWASDTRGTKLAKWEIATGRECRSFYGFLEPYQGPLSCDFSPDGRWLASGDQDGVHLLDLGAGREVAWLPERNIWSVIFAPKGNSLITSGDSGLKRWPIECRTDGEGATLQIGPPRRFDLPGGFGRAALSRDGSTLAFLHANLVHVVEADTWHERTKFNESSRPLYIALSPDGRLGASGGWEVGRRSRVWQSQTGTVVLELPDALQANVAFSPDDKWVVASTSSECRVWEVSSWKCVHVMAREGASGLPGLAAFTSDGRMVALAHTRRTVRLLDTSTWQELTTLEAPDASELHDLHFSADGTRLAAAIAKAIQVWDLRAIRRQLAAMKLDWNLPPLPPPATNQFQAPLTVTVLGNTNEPGTERKP